MLQVSSQSGTTCVSLTTLSVCSVRVWRGQFVALHMQLCFGGNISAFLLDVTHLLASSNWQFDAKYCT